MTDRDDFALWEAEMQETPPDQGEVSVFSSFMATADQIDAWFEMAKQAKAEMGTVIHDELFEDFVMPVIKQAKINAERERMRRYGP